MNISESLKEKVKTQQHLHYLLRLVYHFCLSIVDIFIYKPLIFDKPFAFGNNKSEQLKSVEEYSEGVPVNNMIKQKKYDQVLPFICSGDKILDVACGAGELQEILQNRFDVDVNYYGVDNDKNLISVGEKNGRNLHLLDVSNLHDLEVFLDKYGPFDTIFCVYRIFFFPEPEAFLQVIRGKSKQVILGGFNAGHWSYRLRLLFGRGMCPSPTRYYVPGKVNYAEMERSWTFRDYKFVCESLGYKFRLISAKSASTSIHYKPQSFFWPGLTAMGFIFLLEPEEVDH